MDAWTCRKCQIEKPRSEFNGRKVCKACVRVRQIEWYRANRPRLAAEEKRQRELRTPERAEQDRKRSAAWYAAHRELVAQRSKEQRAAETPEQRSARLEKNRIRSRASYLANIEKRRASSIAVHKALREIVLSAYGRKCACCHETTPEFLSIDHVNGGGSAHRRKVGAGVSMYQWLKRNGFPQEEFRLLCHNCNQARGAYGRCPHETPTTG